MNLVGNGLTTSDAKTKQRISANVVVKSDSDLNSTVASSVPGDGADVGYAFFNCGDGAGTITLSKAGYQTRVEHVTFPIPHNIDYLMEPVGVSGDGAHLEIRNGRFVDRNGRRDCHRGIDLFIGMRLFMDGKLSQLDETIAQYRELGFDWARTFMQGDQGQNWTFSLSPAEPGYRSKIRPYAEFLNVRGMGLLAEWGVDNQIVQTPYSGFTVLGDELVGTTAILSGGNEWQKNGWEPGLLPAPTNGIIWTRGSDLADRVTEPHGAPVASFHQDTDYRKTILDSVASAYEMRKVQSAFANTALMCDEPTRFNQNGTNKSFNEGGTVEDSELLAFQLGKNYSGNWDAAYFHCEAGRWGVLMEKPLERVAREWMRGMRS